MRQNRATAAIAPLSWQSLYTGRPWYSVPPANSTRDSTENIHTSLRMNASFDERLIKDFMGFDQCFK